jgi:hypothetical protein
MSNFTPVVGDVVWFDYRNYPYGHLKGRIKEIVQEKNETWADIVVNKHGIGKVQMNIKYLYPSWQEYDAAKKEESEKRQAEFYKQTSTVEGLLRFLDCREMLIKGDASDDAWAVIQRRLNESRYF